MFLFISGNITLVKKAENMFLSAVWIDSLVASDLLTISTDQTIKSNVYISDILTTNVNARIFNDLLHFADNIVLIGNNSRIECKSHYDKSVNNVFNKNFFDNVSIQQFSVTTQTARVKISICNVEESLKLSDKEGNDMTEHIVGTQMDDLSQIYNGRVLIKGSAKMMNILVFNRQETNNDDPQQLIQSQIVINNIQFDLLNLHQQYWYKATDQVLNSYFFVFEREVSYVPNKYYQSIRKIIKDL